MRGAMDLFRSRGTGSKARSIFLLGEPRSTGVPGVEETEVVSASFFSNHFSKSATERDAARRADDREPDAVVAKLLQNCPGLT